MSIMKKIVVFAIIIILILILFGLWVLFKDDLKYYYTVFTAPSCQSACLERNFSQGICHHTKNWISPEENDEEISILYNSCLGDNFSDCNNKKGYGVGSGQNICCCKK